MTTDPLPVLMACPAPTNSPLMVQIPVSSCNITFSSGPFTSEKYNNFQYTITFVKV